jgi:hypothetical protein
VIAQVARINLAWRVADTLDVTVQNSTEDLFGVGVGLGLGTVLEISETLSGDAHANSFAALFELCIVRIYTGFSLYNFAASLVDSSPIWSPCQIHPLILLVNKTSHFQVTPRCTKSGCSQLLDAAVTISVAGKKPWAH